VYATYLVTTNYMPPRDAVGQLFFTFQKKPKSKSIRFCCKVIPKSFRFGYNVWLKSNIYNINNNIKLWLTLSIKVSGLQYQTQ
jgi:hypothetical protein